MVQEKSPAKEILRAKISFISLCRRGKTRVQSVYKSEDGEVRLTSGSVWKASDNFEEEGLLYSCVYPPYSLDEDGHWAAPSTIRDMAHDALRTGVKIDLLHDEDPFTPDQAAIVESTIIQKGDMRFGDPETLQGGWGVVIKLLDPELRKRYREEGWEGTSFGGEVLLKENEPPALTNKSSMFSHLIGRISNLFKRPKLVQISSPSGTYHISIKTKQS